MRRSQFTLRAAAVHAHARQLLREHLPLRDYKASLPAHRLAAVLLLAACWQASLSAACQLVHGTPSHETVRKALHACLPPRPRRLRDRLLAALHACLPDHLRGCPLPMAIDLHQRPYYGRPTRGSARRQKRKGTRKAFTYATLAVLCPQGRFTAGLLTVRPFMRLTTVLAELFAQAERAGPQAAYLLADKEFYAAEALDWLRRHGIPFVLPMAKRGREGGEATGTCSTRPPRRAGTPTAGWRRGGATTSPAASGTSAGRWRCWCGPAWPATRAAARRWSTPAGGWAAGRRRGWSGCTAGASGSRRSTVSWGSAWRRRAAATSGCGCSGWGWRCCCATSGRGCTRWCSGRGRSRSAGRGRGGCG
jgi:hypothetical protein